jgi:predicted DNA-binding protein
VENGAVKTKRPVGYPVKEIIKKWLQEFRDLWKFAGSPAVKKAMGKDRI